MIKKVFNRITFYALCAVAIGILTMAAFSNMLFQYSETDIAPTQISSQNFKFPNDKTSLENISEQLALKGAALARIEPAAGGNITEKVLFPESVAEDISIQDIPKKHISDTNISSKDTSFPTTLPF